MDKFHYFLTGFVVILAITIIGTLVLLNTRKPTSQPYVLPSPFANSPFPFVTGPGSFLNQASNSGYLTPQAISGEKDFIQQTPILQKLPFDDPYFYGEYISETHIIIHARTSNKDRDYQAARNWFVENGIDYDKIQLEYR